MKRIEIPGTDLKMAQVGFGSTLAGIKYDGKEADRLYDAYFDMDGNVYDTARVYADWIPGEIGRSERVLGDWLQRSKKRNEIILVTKGGHPDMSVEHPDMHKSRISAENMRKDLELSLKTLRTDYIDLYYFHRDNENIPAEELIEVMEQFVKEGKIRYYGCSNWSTARMKKADAYCREKGYRGFVANEALHNVGQQYMKPLTDDTLAVMDEEMRKYHMENPGNMPMPYMSVCSGFFHKLFSGRTEAARSMEYYTDENLRMAGRIQMLMEKYNATVTQAVLGFLTCRDFANVPLYGPGSPEEMEEAIKTFEIPFTREDYIL